MTRHNISSHLDRNLCSDVIWWKNNKRKSPQKEQKQKLFNKIYYSARNFYKEKITNSHTIAIFIKTKLQTFQSQFFEQNCKLSQK
jgi:hypothetical protein